MAYNAIFFNESHTLNSYKRDIKKYKFECNCRLCKRSIQNLGFYDCKLCRVFKFLLVLISQLTGTTRSQPKIK